MTRTYVTVQGDMWDSISFKLFGSGKHIAALIQANPTHKSVFIFSAGVTLAVPDVDISTVSSNTPPWKRVSG